MYSASSILFPLNLIRLLFSLFRIVLEGFTKTAICQGHRLHFAICCKIKLGEVVYFSLFGLPLPSTTFLFTSGLTCCKSVREGGREDREGEMTWMATKVEMSFCALCGSGTEISWHLIVPFLFIYFFLQRHWCIGKRTKTHLSIALFLPHFVPNMSPWTVSTVVALSAPGM